MAMVVLAVAAAAAVPAPAYGWGVNNYGDVGDGTTNNPRRTPVPVAGLGDATQLAAGTGFFIARHADGTLSGRA